MAISTLSLSAIKLSESSINSGNLNEGRGLDAASISSDITATSIFARFATLAAATSYVIKIL